ncbi:MAG TPA: sulfite reductase flavoprotein subunit alpha [Pseudonocardia sp.]
MSSPVGATTGSGPATQAGEAPPVRALYGSETGNAELVARDLVTAARGRGVQIRLSTLDDVSPDELVGEGCVLVVTSTTGEGDLPYNAERFWAALSADSAPRLDGVVFSVLGLGDTGYFDFCQAAEVVDSRLAELGARRLLELRRCDVDYEDDAARWAGEILDAVAGRSPAAAGTPSEPAAPVPADSVPAVSGATGAAGAAAPGWSRQRPYRATVLSNRPLTGKGSIKEVRHLELALDERDLDYRPGDSLGILPSNDPVLVGALLAHLGEPGERDVDGRSLHDALTTDHEISRPSRELVEEVGRRTEDPDLVRLLAGEDRHALHEFLWARDILDLLRLATRPPLTAPELLGLLRPLAHRSYSISSSPLVAPGRVDLAVATLRYRAAGRDRGGVCSTHLADRLAEGDTAAVFLVRNEVFRPPADDADMIMVGPGTGVAPFRAFLHERRARGARGRNWLFFGGRHRRCDLLYGDELAAMTDDGLLTELDLAFSRDEAEKVYVQTRMRQRGEQLFEWLARDARLYVCGDAVNMAGDVDRALHEIVAEHGGMSPDAAADWVDGLRRDRRYVRDVY